MNTTYISEKEGIIEALNEIDEFLVKMKKFVKIRPDYLYSISIRQNLNKRSNNQWIIELNVLKDEGNNKDI